MREKERWKKKFEKEVEKEVIGGKKNYQIELFKLLN